MSSSARRVLRPLLRRAVYPAVEAAWSAGFRLAGWHRGSRPQPWSTPGGIPVGIVAPHPDDETIGCGGVAVLHRAAGDRVAALIVTDGGASRAGGQAGPMLVRRRAAEARAAAARLGLAALEQAGLPEGAWPLPAGVAAIAAWLATARPALLYAPSPVDYHPEHLRVARALATALAGLPPSAQPRVRIYEVFVPLGPGLINCVAGLGPGRDAKAAALCCYRSQAAGLAQVPRRDRYLAGFYGLRGAAEGFCALPAAAYTAFVAAADWTGRPCPYRGLHPRPFTDPLAHLVGGGARRALRTAVPVAFAGGGRAG